jgi:tRNA nucleotidyltransferase/poly(A) polymerase
MLSAQQLKVKILKDKYNSILFKKSRGRGLYLVGGYLRDILRGKDSKDRDFIVSDDLKVFVHTIKKILRGTIIEFKKGGTVRLVLKNGITMDFSSTRGSIIEDLSKRDFTMNALAWSPESGLIDPFEGIKDIEKKIIRSINKNNLFDDPLRMLRAYRLASELNGKIEKKTRKLIKTFYYKIKNSSPERITFELFNLLNSEKPGNYLSLAFYDKILTLIFPINTNNLMNNIKVISKFINQLEEYPKEIKVILEDNFSQNLKYKGLLILELLIIENGNFTSDKFPLLKLSKSIIKRLLLVNKVLKEFRKDNLFDFFFKSKESSIDIILIKNELKLINEYIRYKIIWRKGLISPSEIKRIFKIKDGQILGRIISEVKRAEFNKEIKNKIQAKQYINNILHNISYQT